MSSLDREILSEYVDGQLDDDARISVAVHLAENSGDAEIVEQYRLQSQAIDAAFASILQEPVPDELIRTVRRGTAEMQKPRIFEGLRPGWVLAGAFASLLLLVGSGALGWIVRGTHEAEQLNALMIQQFVRTASDAYTLYDRDTDRSGDLRTERMKEFVAWLYESFGKDFTPPKLEDAGFDFAGGRLLPSVLGPAAQITYIDKDDRRLTLYFVKGAANGHIESITQFIPQKFGEFETYFFQDDKRSVYFWDRKPLKYALVSEMKRDDLFELTEGIVSQLIGTSD